MEGYNFNHKNKGSLQARFDSYCKKVIYHSVYNTVNRQTSYLMKNWGTSYFEEDGIQDDIGVDFDAVQIAVGNHVVMIHDSELADAILMLQKRKQEIVLLNEILGYSLSEIAKMLGITYESVKSAKSKAFREMRKGAEEKLNERQ